MPFMDELKRLVRPYSDDEDDYDEDEMEEEEDVEEEEEEPVRPARRQPAPKAAPKAAPQPAAKAAPVYAAPVATPAASVNSLRSNNNSLQMILVKPERYDEVSSIADHLRDKNAVVLNLEACDRSSSKRIVDFLSGCAYALEGNIKKVATCTYVITPYNVDVVGELTPEETEASTITY